LTVITRPLENTILRKLWDVARRKDSNDRKQKNVFSEYRRQALIFYAVSQKDVVEL